MADLVLDVAAPSKVPLDLVVYHCDEAAAALCMIHMARLDVPVEVKTAGPSAAAVWYAVSHEAAGR